jgi:hypothetical protein
MPASAATASTAETNDQKRSTPMEFEVAHSFSESRVLASYPLPQGTNAIGNACFLSTPPRHKCIRQCVLLQILRATPLSGGTSHCCCIVHTPPPLLTETRAEIKAIRPCQSDIPR